jgi:sugar lactone lactonase YvrE
MKVRILAAICAVHSAALYAASISVAAGPETVRLNEPFAAAFDRSGNLYILEHKGQKIVRAGKGGGFSPFAGAGAPIAAQFNDPHGLLVTRDGRTMFVADTLNNQVRVIDLRARTISTLAGTGEKSFSGDGGPARQASFSGVFAIALSPDEKSLYVADLGNRRIRQINLMNGIITTAAGNGERGIPADGSLAVQGPLQDPRAVAVDSKGLLYIVERNGNALRVVDRSGIIRTLLAPGKLVPDLKGPKHLCIDSRDNVIIADTENHIIRRFNPRDGSVVTIAGSGAKGARVAPGNPLDTELNRPHGVAFDRAGNLFISDSDNHRILRLSSR